MTWFANLCFSPVFPLVVVKEGKLLSLWRGWFGRGDAQWQRDGNSDPSMPGPGGQGWGAECFTHILAE